jgi:hypothetical protein
MTDVALSCACGKIKGTLAGASPKSGTRIFCYCGDCQAYGRFLGRDDLLDEWGGISIFQVAPAHVTLEWEPGALACMRLSEKGLYRWYCAECKTPVGNSMTPRMPFVGMSTNMMPNTNLDEVLGPVLGHIQQKSAKKGGPPHPENNPRVIRRALGKFLSWKIRGLGMPHPFWRDVKTPRVTPRVLSPAERSAL